MYRQLIDRTLFLILILCSFDVAAQVEDLPFNNGFYYLKGDKNIESIKVTRRYSEGDYHLESVHYFNKLNQNYLTVDKYKDTMCGRTEIRFNQKGQVKRMVYFSISGEKKDSLTLGSVNEYYYNSKGKIKRATQVFYGRLGPSNKYTCIFKYDKKDRVIEAQDIFQDLSIAPSIYFKPNSSEVTTAPQMENKYTKKCAYNKKETTIKYYTNTELVTTQKEQRLNKSITMSLIDLKGDTLRSAVTLLDKKGNIIKIQYTGDLCASVYGTDGDCLNGSDMVEYIYNELGLIKREIYGSTKSDWKIFIDYEYTKRVAERH